jgi:putative transposase
MGQHLSAVLPGRTARGAAYRTGGRRCRGLAIAGQTNASAVLKRNASIAFGSCTSSGTPSTTCRARPTTTACRSRAGSEPALRPAKPDRGDRRELAEAKADLAAWLKKWGARYDRLTSWVEENIEETFTYYRLPRQHHKHTKSTNMLERLNEEIERRTHVVRIFPNAESCLRLVRALAVEAHENWLEANRYLNMDDLREQKKLQLREAA